MDLFKNRRGGHVPGLRGSRPARWFVLKYCQVEKRVGAHKSPLYGDGHAPDHKWYAFDPAVIYPATIQRIKEVVASRDSPIPEELIDNQAPPGVEPRSVAVAYVNTARLFPLEAWDWALQDRDLVYDPKQIALRAEALTLARRWFTQALHCAVGSAVGVHILKDDYYRL